MDDVIDQLLEGVPSSDAQMQLQEQMAVLAPIHSSLPTTQLQEYILPNMVPTSGGKLMRKELSKIKYLTMRWIARNP